VRLCRCLAGSWPSTRRADLEPGIAGISPGSLYPTCYHRAVDLDTSRWSGDGAFTQLLIDALGTLDAVQRVRVEDAPASRADAGFSFISDEIFITFRRHGLLGGRRPRMTLAGLEFALAAHTDIGAPEYGDAGMLQYLRTERIVPPFQTRGYKLVEMVRIYAAAGRNPGKA